MVYLVRLPSVRYSQVHGRKKEKMKAYLRVRRFACLYKEENEYLNAQYARGQDEAKVPSKFRPSDGSTNFVISSNSTSLSFSTFL